MDEGGFLAPLRRPRLWRTDRVGDLAAVGEEETAVGFGNLGVGGGGLLFLLLLARSSGGGRILGVKE